MVKCPKCGADLPNPAHFGLKASPKNYLTPMIELTPGVKYIRTFAILFYPERRTPTGVLPHCVVIASEEYPREAYSIPFIAGAKFYANQIHLLNRAAEDVMLTELAFRCMINPRLGPPEAILRSRLQTLYYSPEKREELHHRLMSIYNNMIICRNVTAREEIEGVEAEGGNDER